MNADKKLQEILKVSLKYFARYGYKKTTMEDIARELEMTKGALYLYVKNKQDLYEKTIAENLIGWQSRVKEAVDKESNPIAKFVVLSFKAFQYLSENKDLRQVLVNNPEIFPIFDRHDPYSDINENSREMIKSILREGISQKVFRDIDVDSIAWLAFSVYKMFIIDTYILSDKKTTWKLFQDSVELAIHGLLKKPVDIQQLLIKKGGEIDNQKINLI
ncbi:MAG: TetR/AcrR family transcriptional regulator [Dethiobacteria bacterium]